MLSLLVGSVLLCAVFGQPSGDAVPELKGVTWTLNYDIYSGYLDVAPSKHLHYLLTESQSDATTDPVVLWLNGGPGCSSLDGFLYEQGPIHVNTDGTPYNSETNAWNTNANLLFLEAPVCVGFSYEDGNSTCTQSDDETADDNYHALLAFFEKFPNFAGREFYVTGESYGGVYVPTLTRRIIQGNLDNEGAHINLKGFAVGNGILNAEKNENSAIWLAYHHGFVDESLWDQLRENCCVSPFDRHSCYFADKSLAPSPLKCASDVQQVMGVIYGGQLNWYNIYGPCETTLEHVSFDKYIRTLENIHENFHEENDYALIKKLRAHHELGANVPCIDSTGANVWLNDATVQQQLHVSGHDITWTICSDNLRYQKQYPDLSPVFEDIFSMDPSIYATVYNGDTDFSCNFLGDEWFVRDLNMTATDEYHEWYSDSDNYGTQVGGWNINYERLSFVTIRGAGHMVPQFKPKLGFEMFQAFLSHSELPH